MRITHIAPLSVAKVAFVLYGLIGLIIGGIIAIASLLGASLGAAHGDRSSLFGMIFGVGAVIFLPLVYGFFLRHWRPHLHGDLQHRGGHGRRRRTDDRAGARGALMPRLIAAPTVVAAAGNKPKRIEEFAGRVNSGHAVVSVARMVSPGGWVEPGQRPEFEEITVVLRGTLRVEHDGGVLDVAAGQAVVTAPGEWVRYSTPGAEGAEYVAVCLPAFSPATVHRDE